ncbi:MAG TPA: class I SAM-dependent methyltransferase [Candidatus Paceibacterota bacterium]|nr:class I SAM-dependent methyltransferase [Candidatus Paceibacterota bacterium]HRZ34342.1 class I SAM-dependent methyltransferase [Candidatus Paceibacterota bacterium]
MDPKIEKRFENTAKSKTFQNVVRAFGLDKKAVLDIGCSYGEFLAKFGKGSAGVTINPEESRFGRERGLDIRLGNIEASDFVLNEKYDVIFANNLFEHLYSPHDFLCRIKKYLKPNGLLILGVPCIPKIVSLLHVKKFRGSLADAHINFFTRGTLIKTIERSGWKLITARGFHFANKIVDHLLDPIYPHFYVAAVVDPNFQYSEKRLRELAGYKR